MALLVGRLSNVLVSPWLIVQILSSPPEQAKSSNTPEKLPGLVMALGRFRVYFAANPRDKKSLG
jgi:hypothetical protein